MISVLDTSALICFVKKEPGWEVVLDVLEQEILINSANLAEFYTWITRNNNDLEKAIELVKDLEITVQNFDEIDAAAVAKIYPKTSPFGLSLGDRAAIVTAIRLKTKVYTADKIWKEIKLADLEVVLIR
ncbi:MAG: type II toxin-antitoxin system VapC family toxin [bacterium]